MREIEIKLRVRQPEVTLAVLDKAGVRLGEATKQHDVVYGVREGESFTHDGNWLRVRTENDKRVIFTLKRSVTGELDSIEHETEVASEAEITNIIQQLGYELYSDITKIRRKGHTGDMEICYDKVPRLGTFLEIELLSPEDADYDAVMHRLWQTAESLGLSKADEETSGYDVLIKKLEGRTV